MTATPRHDVCIVGASIAGCVAAIAFARAGVSVAVLERHADVQAFKHLCTHYIQASATPVLRRLGLAARLEAAGAVRNLADIHTRWGWLNEPDMHDPSGAPLHGYSMTRARLDPLLKQCMVETPGVSYFPGVSARALHYADGCVAGVTAGVDNTLFAARLVVAADGRNSPLAVLAQAPTSTSPNHRGGVFAVYRGLGLRRGKRAQMWLHGRDVGYVFPNEGDLTVVTAMPGQSEIPRFKADPAGELEKFIAALDDAPDFRHAERVSEVFVVRDYPNQSRPSVVAGMALIGDAAVSMDPLFGVGCGWAIQSADWLVTATAPALLAGSDLGTALAAYARRHRAALGGHQFVLKDFSRRFTFSAIERLMFAAAARDDATMRHVTRFATRYASLGEFLAPRALLRAAWVNLRAALQ